MVFEEKSKGLDIKCYPDNGKVDRHIYLDSERASNLDKLQTVYQKEALKYISYNMLFKIAIDYLIESLEDLSEDDAIELLKEYHKKAFF